MGTWETTEQEGAISAFVGFSLGVPTELVSSKVRNVSLELKTVSLELRNVSLGLGGGDDLDTHAQAQGAVGRSAAHEAGAGHSGADSCGHCNRMHCTVVSAEFTR